MEPLAFKAVLESTCLFAVETSQLRPKSAISPRGGTKGAGTAGREPVRKKISTYSLLSACPCPPLPWRVAQICLSWEGSTANKMLTLVRDQPKQKQKCLGCTRKCRNVSAERPANWARPICQWPFRLISNANAGSKFAEDEMLKIY